MNFFTKSWDWNVSYFSVYCRNTKWESLTRPIHWTHSMHSEVFRPCHDCLVLLWLYFFAPLFFGFTLIFLLCVSHPVFTSRVCIVRAVWVFIAILVNLNNANAYSLKGCHFSYVKYSYFESLIPSCSYAVFIPDLNRIFLSYVVQLLLVRGF